MCDSCLDINEVPVPRLAVNNILQFDPTRTLTLRKAFVTDMDKRFNALKRLIRESIIDNDCFGLVTPATPFSTLAAATPGQFRFDRSAAKVEGFMAWLQEQEKAGVLQLVNKSRIGTPVEQLWANTYIDTAYQRGIRRGREELRKQGVDIPTFGDKQLRDPVIAAFNQPVHADRVGLIYSRVYSDLKGITSAMDTQISRVLAQGLAEGRNPRELARTINDRVDKIGITRARMLARTEVIRAHHAANVQEYRNAGIEGVSVMVEWSTAGYKVCTVCSALQGKRFTLDEIEFMIPKHPNCRCVAIPDVSGKGVVEAGFMPSATLAEAQQQISSLFNIDNIGEFGAFSLSEEAVLESVNNIGKELQRLETLLPGISKLTAKPSTAAMAAGRKLTVNLRETGIFLGEYNPKLNEIQIIPVSAQKKVAELGETFSWQSTRNDAGHTFRHEYAHAIHAQGLSSEKYEQWYALYKNEPMDFWAKEVSDYGSVSATELFAESFAAYTSTVYKKGFLPKAIEDFFQEVLK